MTVPWSSLQCVSTMFINSSTSRAVENFIPQQIQTRPSVPTLKPQSHVESVASRNLRASLCSFLFLASPPRHPREGEWVPLLTAGSSSHLEGHAPTPGPGTEEPQGGSGGLLAALLCCLFPLLVGRGVTGCKLWGCSP